ncbi:MAG: alpha/beta hydrolase-fold protein [Bacteroidia bacterium]
MDSQAFEGERRVRVFLPERYRLDTTRNLSSPMCLTLSQICSGIWRKQHQLPCHNFQIIPTIVVGIVSDNRGYEFNPENGELHEHLKNEVFPLIEANYRVGTFRALIGHSWGGAFVGNTLFGEHSDLFDAYIGISPSLDAIDGRIFRHADSMLQKGLPKGKFFIALRKCGQAGNRIHRKCRA